MLSLSNSKEMMKFIPVRGIKFKVQWRRKVCFVKFMFFFLMDFFSPLVNQDVDFLGHIFVFW